MDNSSAIQIAAAYLTGKRIGFCDPVHTVKIDSNTLEVVFTAPGALDPNMVVDPPDVRVRIDMHNQSAELVPDM